MTLFLPLAPDSPLPSTPSFLAQAANPSVQLLKLVHAILKAKRIVVLCGAGISVQAGIPDFRSPDGLFRTLKRDNPRENLASGKDLFDASVFNAEHTTSLFCQMIAQLSRLSEDAQPTAFHRVLRALDDHGRLLRVYTQNIDAIEQKTGLSFGVPEFEDRRSKNRSKGKTPANKKQLPSSSFDNNTITCDQSSGPSARTTPSTSANIRFPSPSAETPRCIPLHGTVQSVHCQVCNHSFPLRDHLESLALGQPPQCPECTSLERTRQLIGKRPRGIGKLRPSVVLYNEEHRDGEGVGDVVRKDLMGSKGRSGADLLLVVGTSLRVPGTKRMVREFSKAVRPRTTKEDGLASSSSGITSGSATPSNSAYPSPAAGSGTEEESSSMKAVYLNLDFPVPTREWEGVFDVWLQGDAQQFAQLLQDELEKQVKAKEVAIEKKRKRDEEAALAPLDTPNHALSTTATTLPLLLPVTHKPAKRKTSSDSTASKRRKVPNTVALPPSPPKSPRTVHANSDLESMDVDIDDDNDMDLLPVLPSETCSSSSSSISSSSSYQRISPLIIRIPPRSRCYVDIPPISKIKTPHRSQSGSLIRLPLTPEDTPPSRFKLPRPMKMTMSAARKRAITSPPTRAPKHHAPASVNDLTSSIIEIGLSEDEIDDYDALPISCVRSTQVGLLS